MPLAHTSRPRDPFNPLMMSDPQLDRPTSARSPRLHALDLLLFSAWCGLAAGELEVAARVVYRALSTTNRLFALTRHFVWLAPTLNLALFLCIGAVLALAVMRWPRSAGWLAPRLLCVLALLPMLLLIGRNVHPAAWVVFAMGVASVLARLIERRPDRTRKVLLASLPVLLVLVLAQAGMLVVGDRLKHRREDGRPPPPQGSPNVLLIVLDTVRADRLSLYGHPRPTSKTLERLAEGGVRFDNARAAAPWTLPSHATLFTGVWPHQIGEEWMHPIKGDATTLAEFLGARGYATAGFIGNTLYCSYDSGLNRGFTHYEDYKLGMVDALRTAHLIDQGLKAIHPALLALGQLIPGSPFLPLQELVLRQLSYDDRKNAAMINRQFLDWLASPRSRQRPFFAFLNYVDAHAPYVLPPGAEYRFGVTPRSEMDFLFLLEGWFKVDRTALSAHGRALARDSYDNCLAYLDDRLAELFVELDRRGILRETLVVITADHGENLGEHGLYDHGESLYRPEIRVPLLIVPPGDQRTKKVVDRVVSLRDLPATIAELAAPGARSPFPGRSMAWLWRDSEQGPTEPSPEITVFSELAAPNPIDPNQGRSPAHRGPLVSLADGNYIYIRNQGDGGEELFDGRDDPRELSNLAGNSSKAESVRPILEAFRRRLRELNLPP